MNRLEWDEAILTGDRRVDEQHRRIFELTKEFADVVRDGADRESTADALYALMRYAATHVSDEEALMERVGYPQLERQRTLHARFLRQTSDLADDFLSGRSVSGQPLLAHLVELWQEHICVEDRAVADHIRGIAPAEEPIGL